LVAYYAVVAVEISKIMEIHCSTVLIFVPLVTRPRR
jgi:hypothetical protein